MNQDARNQPISEPKSFGKRCPYCGGEWEVSFTHELSRWECRHCGTSFHVSGGDDRNAKFDCYRFADEIIRLIYADVQNEEECDALWSEMKIAFSEFQKKYGSKLAEEGPYFGMIHVAYLTRGFRKYPKIRRTQIKTLLDKAEAYLLGHPSENVQSLVTQCREMIRKYQEKQKKVKTITAISVPSALVAAVVAFFVILGLYVPSPMDSESGIGVDMNGKTVSLFDKFTVDVAVEKHPSHAAAYIDAKNALRNETETFELFDISLSAGGELIQPRGAVTVSIPIPAGYQPGCLKVYHVLSDEQYEEIPSTVSVAKNTISFETTHFSLFAVAERHPIVTFDANGGSEIPRQIVRRDELAVPPETPTRNGYTFMGWFSEGEVWDFADDTVKKDITLTAEWKANEYTVTLQPNGGHCALSSLSLAYLSTYQALPTPTKEGYTFLGWYTGDTAEGVQVKPDSVMERMEDHTLYALYRKNENRVLFHANGGDGAMEDFRMETGDTARLPDNKLTRVGYTFLGWSTTMTGEVAYADEATYTMGTAETYTLYAKWQINTNTLRFDANGGTGSMAELRMDYNTTQRLPVCTLTRTGYRFVGWSLTPTGDVAYADKLDFTMGDKAENILYAKWEKNSYKVQFVPNGGTGSMSYITIEYEDIETLPECTFTRPGFHFVGWSDAPAGQKLYEDRAEFHMSEAGDCLLYALWVGNENRFTFYANDGTGHMPTDFTISTGGTENLPTNQFTRDGYVFIGWSTSPGGSVKYEDGAAYTLASTGDVELYAKWQVVDYTIQYVVNGGAAIADKKYTVVSETIPLPNPIRKGYRFDGWFTGADFAGYPVSSVDKGSFGDKVFYAKWTVVEYEISFDTKGGNHLENMMHTIEHDTCALPTPVRVGFQFDGWYADETFTGEPVVTIDNTVTGNRHYVAKWTPVTYTIRLESNGGTMFEDISYNIESAEVTLPTPEKAGYLFLGWYSDPKFQIGGYLTVISSGSHEDMTLYAKWEAGDQILTFDSKGGSLIDTKAFSVESADIDLTSTAYLPTRAGYTFDGWFDNEAYTGNAVTKIAKGTVGNVMLYAKWTLNTYTVTFVPNGGSAVEALTYTIENAYQYFPEPQRPGYQFGGWYIDEGLHESAGSAAGGGAIGDMTLYAAWLLLDQYIMFDCMGGNGMETITFTVEDASIDLTLPSRTPAYYGYTFGGWFDNELCTGDAVTEVAKGTVGNVKLYAKWTPTVYTVTFDALGGSAVEDITYTIESDPISLLTVKSAMDHYTFVEWRDSDGYTVLAINPRDCKNITLYATFEASVYQITFDSVGGTKTEPIDYTIETAVTDLGYAPIRDGYTFGGWYADKSYSGSAVTSFPKGTTGDRTLYAKWEAVTYTVTFNPNGGSAVNETNSLTYKVTDADVWLNQVAATTREGYTFGGWKDGSGNIVRKIAKGSFGDMELVAVWSPIDYTISYVVNGGDNLPNGSYTIESGANLPTPNKNGYAFLGWYDNAERTGDPVAYIDVGSIGAKKLYADWSDALEYTITLDPANGDAVQYIKYTVESDTFALDVPVWFGHPFGGWLNEDGTAVSVITKGAYYEDMVLTAAWGDNEYDIIYHWNGGKEVTSNPTRYEYGVETLDIKDPQYMTYPEYNHFVGWYEDAAFTRPFDPENADLLTNPRKLELYARWDLVTVYIGVSRLPDSLINEDKSDEELLKRFLIDLSSHRGDTECNKTITLTNRSEVILYGNAEALYKNLHIVVQDYTELDRLTLILDNFNMTGEIVGTNNAAGMEVVITNVGTSSITGTSAQMAISDFSSLSIVGNGALQIGGGHGVNDGTAGSNGGIGATAIRVDYLTIDMIGELTISGGNGGNGYEGKTGTYDSHAGNGGNGGNGGMALDCQSVSIIESNIKISIIGGNGGDGGKGGYIPDGSQMSGMYNLADAGNGGQGGNGGAPTFIPSLNSITCLSLELKYGNGGNGGEGGRGGDPKVVDNKQDPDQMSDGGHGGHGGNGFTAGNGGDGGRGGGSYGTDRWNTSSGELWGTSGDGGNGGNGGDRIYGVLYTGGVAQLLITDKECGKGGALGKAGPILDDGEPEHGLSGSHGVAGTAGSTDNSYYFEFIEQFKVGLETYNGHQYMLFSRGLSWTAAKSACEALGGHLVTITSEEENAFVHTLAAGNNVWLGGNNIKDSGQFDWTTGEEVSYTNWGPGRPDDANWGIGFLRKEYLYMYNNSEWGNNSNQTDYYYICEWENHIVNGN